MRDVNEARFTGRLTRDPDLRYTNATSGQFPEGKPVCNVTLAQNSRTKDQDGQWIDGDPIFVDVAIWGRDGEAFAKAHKKGDLAYVEGKLRFDTWGDKRDGSKRSKLKIDADRWFLHPITATDTPFGG